MDKPTDLERVVWDLAWEGRSKCGVGFGKYPLGIKRSLEVLLPLVRTDLLMGHKRITIGGAVEEFYRRLER